MTTVSVVVKFAVALARTLVSQRRAKKKNNTFIGCGGGDGGGGGDGNDGGCLATVIFDFARLANGNASSCRGKWLLFGPR